ncbi:MAG: NAD/NADP octopine/nopaline dehydrogenase family protein [Bacillota bacterium]
MTVQDGMVLAGAPSFAVLGIGNGGQAMAGYLALHGFRVKLWNRSPGKVDAVNSRGGIRLLGAAEGIGVPLAVTRDIASACGGSDVLMVTVPASGHRDVARMLAPHLVDGQVVVLNPGRTGGALAFRANLERAGCRADITVAETNTFIFASRTVEPGISHIYGIKKHVSLAALPAYRTEEVLSLVRTAFPQFIPADNVLATSLDNMGAIFHPVPALFNVTRLEAGEKYEHYMGGISRSVARLLERLDAERVAIARVLGVSARSALEWLKDTYGVTAHNLYEAIQSNAAYRGILAPDSLDTRYIHEDVPFSLVPLVHLAEFAGLRAPVLRSVIAVAEGLLDRDFWAEGRDADEMRVSDMTVPELRAFVEEGEESWPRIAG